MHRVADIEMQVPVVVCSANSSPSTEVRKTTQVLLFQESESTACGPGPGRPSLRRIERSEWARGERAGRRRTCGRVPRGMSPNARIASWFNDEEAAARLHDSCSIITVRRCCGFLVDVKRCVAAFAIGEFLTCKSPYCVRVKRIGDRSLLAQRTSGESPHGGNTGC